jgi:DNA-binding NarL/FixJ family response regulator
MLNLTPLRIVIAEDHVMLREALIEYCTVQLGATVVGAVGSGRLAMRVIEDTRPDVVLVDLFMPDGDGFEVTAFTLARCPATRVLMLSSHCDNYTLLRVEQSGAHGFLDKNTQAMHILRRAFEALSRGESFYSQVYLDAKQARAKDPNVFAKVLSERECDVLSLIGLSLSDLEIAQLLSISPNTAQTHRSNIMRKLGVVSTVKLVQFAMVHGFTRLVKERNGIPVFS